MWGRDKIDNDKIYVFEIKIDNEDTLFSIKKNKKSEDIIYKNKNYDFKKNKIYRKVINVNKLF